MSNAIEPYSYQVQKTNEALRALLPPHPEGDENISFAYAFAALRMGFEHPGMTGISDADALRWTKCIKEAMDTSGVVTTDGRGANYNRAKALTLAEKSEFSHAVYELSHWFRREHDGTQ